MLSPHSANFLLGFPVHTPNRATTLYKFGIIVGATPGHVRIALYQDNGAGIPGALIVNTGQVTLTAGRNEIISATTPLLANTDYFIMALFDAATNVGNDGSATHSVYYKSQPYANPFSTTLNDGNSANATTTQPNVGLVNYYILVY